MKRWPSLACSRKCASGFGFTILRFRLRKSTFTGFDFSSDFMGCGILRRWGGWRLRRSDAFGERAQCRGLDAPTGAIGAHVFVSRSAGIGLPWMMEIGRPKTPQRLPEVLAVSEVLCTLSLMHATLAKLLYGTG